MMNSKLELENSNFRIQVEDQSGIPIDESFNILQQPDLMDTYAQKPPSKKPQRCCRFFPKRKSFKICIVAVGLVLVSNTCLVYMSGKCNLLSMVLFLALILCFSNLLFFLPMQSRILTVAHVSYISTLIGQDIFFLHLDSLLPICILMYAAKSNIFSSGFYFLLVHSVLLISYIVLSLYLAPSYFFPILLCECFAIALAVELTNLHRNSKQDPIKVIPDAPPVTELEEIQRFIKKGTLQLSDLMEELPGQSRSKLSEVRQALSHAMKLTTSDNLFLPKVEVITHDEEEKIYIQENYEPQGFARSISSLSMSPVFAKVTAEDSTCMMSSMGRAWNFNSFLMEECTGNVLEAAGKYIVQQYDLDNHFSIPAETLMKFFKSLETNYQPNPYHNSVHAADVLCSYCFLVNNSRILSNLTTIEILSGIIANAAHDVGHTGVTNRFLVNSKDKIAVRYNDHSVLEMMHASLTFEILNEHNILKTLSSDEWVDARKIIIEMILATDMTKHFELLAHFKAKLEDKTEQSLGVVEHRLQICKLIIKAADIGHSAKHWALHKRWTLAVIQEFFNQGDCEINLGLPVSMFCDRKTTNVNKCQAGFIRNIAMPLYESLNACLASPVIERTCIKQLAENLGKWEKKNLKKKTTEDATIIYKKSLTEQLRKGKSSIAF